MAPVSRPPVGIVCLFMLDLNITVLTIRDWLKLGRTQVVIEVGSLHCRVRQSPPVQLELIDKDTVHTVLLSPGQSLEPRVMDGFAVLRKMSKGAAVRLCAAVTSAAVCEIVYRTNLSCQDALASSIEEFQAALVLVGVFVRHARNSAAPARLCCQVQPAADWQEEARASARCACGGAGYSPVLPAHADRDGREAAARPGGGAWRQGAKMGGLKICMQIKALFTEMGCAFREKAGRKADTLRA